MSIYQLVANQNKAASQSFLDHDYLIGEYRLNEFNKIFAQSHDKKPDNRCVGACGE